MDRKKNEVKLNKKAQINLEKLQIFLKKENGKRNYKYWNNPE
jgi:hypothetical protein